MASYIIYCRKSSESEERQVLSIESQIKELNDLAKRSGLSISEVLTESRSAKFPGRPIFGRLMEKVSRGEIKGIVCWKLDRLARNPLDGGAIVWALDQGKVQEIITPSNHLRNNSNDKFLMQLEFGMAKKYVDDLSDNVSRGLRMKLEKGWLPGKAPLGYFNEPYERTIVPDPARFQIVRRMWELLLAGTPPLRIHQIAAEELGLRTKMRTKAVGNPVSISTVYNLFTNPFYYGVIRRKGAYYAGKHTPMITENEFWEAQRLLGCRGITRPKTKKFAYTGLMKCGECGCSITAEEKVNKYGRHYIYYHCTKKKRGRNCNQRVIQETELEKQMVAYLEQVYLPPSFLRLGLDQIQKQSPENRERELVYQKSLEKAISDCERKLENLKQMRLGDLLGDEEYLLDRKKFTEEKARMGVSLQNLQILKGGVDTLIVKALTYASEARDRFSKANPETRKAILTELGSNFFLKDKKLFIELRKPFHLVKNMLDSLQAGGRGIELSKNPMDERLIGPQTPEFQFMCSLVHDVRTFFVRNDAESRHSDTRIAA